MERGRNFAQPVHVTQACLVLTQPITLRSHVYALAPCVFAMSITVRQTKSATSQQACLVAEDRGNLAVMELIAMRTLRMAMGIFMTSSAPRCR